MEIQTPARLIQEYSSGDVNALNHLFVLIYDELQTEAHRQRNRWNGLQTFNTIDLIHETYLKLWDHQPNKIENQKHFLAIAAKAMRHILINQAEKRSAQKRGGDLLQVSSDNLELIANTQEADELLALDETLKRLEKKYPRQIKVFEYRFFGGLTVENTASILHISQATVKRDWQAACNWIYNELKKQ
jgi:RNA polymerase sigma factor (TIGR02999 family)